MTDKNSVDLTLCARWVYTSPAPDLNYLKNKVKIENLFPSIFRPRAGLGIYFSVNDAKATESNDKWAMRP